jgi:hypothetical protein
MLCVCVRVILCYALLSCGFIPSIAGFETNVERCVPAERGDDVPSLEINGKCRRIGGVYKHVSASTIRTFFPSSICGYERLETVS